MNYKLVTYREDGETYDLEEQFEAGNDAEANAYAEQRGQGTNWENDWFVLRLLTRPGRNHPSWTNINE